MKSVSILLLSAFVLSTHASELTRGKKALFTEDFEADIYEWEVMEEGETEEENPKLGTWLGKTMIGDSMQRGNLQRWPVRRAK